MKMRMPWRMLVVVLLLSLVLSLQGAGVIAGELSGAGASEATTWVSTADETTQAALPATAGATEDWWAAAQAHIRQDIGQPEGTWEGDDLSTSPDWSRTGEQSGDGFALSVANAGDVNGDGYGDVIVGAPYFSGGVNRGKAYLYLGSETGLETMWDWTQTGENNADLFGSSVASAGDVNGDGFGDVVVGARGYATVGRAYVFLGSDAGLGLSPLPPFDGEASGDDFGSLVAGPGDLNGDGYADIIVGAWAYNDVGVYDVGRVYIYHGGASGPDTTADRILTGENQSDWFGRSAAGAGDVNGDGYADVIIGATGYDNGTATQSGAAYVFFGGSTGVSTGWTWKQAGVTKDDLFGSSVAGAGDVNGDGYADIIIGAKAFGGDTPGAPHQGAAYVYHGGAKGIPNGSDPAWWKVGQNDDDLFGTSVASAGDVDGDGYADVIVGASGCSAGAGRGRAYLYKGSADGLVDTPTWLPDGENDGDEFAASVAGAGDVNGDGYADVIVGAGGFSGDGGKAYAYHGAADMPSATDDWREEGDTNGDQFGFSMAGAGDMNGDGYADVIIGAWGYNLGRGRVYGYFGADTGLPSFPNWYAEGTHASEWFGASVAGAGDVNGDGYGDVIVGARGYKNDADQVVGRAYVFYGSPDIADSEDSDWQATGEAEWDYFGRSVAGAGDVNGDGYADVIVGAEGYDVNTGKVYVYHGSAAGLSTTADRELLGAKHYDYFGYSVAGAGDLNGDGYGDVVVGAYGWSEAGVGSNYKGKAQAFYGTPSGLGPIAVWTGLGANDGDYFGWSVTGAGDVNGDGCDDVLVGAYQRGSGRGSVYLYDFTSGGVGGVWQTDGVAVPDNFGYSVAGAGDVNGDGFADLLVGAINLSSGTMKGYTHLYLGPRPAGITYPYDWGVDGENAGDRFGTSVAGAGDLNGDGYSDLLIGASSGGSGRGKAYAYLGNDGGGRRVLARQYGQDRMQVQPWGLAGAQDEFVVWMWASNPVGRGRIKLQAEACPPGVTFGDTACTTASGGVWEDLFPSGEYATQRRIGVRISGLDEGMLYRWRARVLYAPFFVLRTGITPPPNPAHSPWRRFLGQAFEADLRTSTGSRVYLPLVLRAH